MRNRLPRGWRIIRRAILERDNYQCQIRMSGCTGQATQVDHLVARRFFAAGDPTMHLPENLRASCASCNLRRSNERHNTSRDW